MSRRRSRRLREESLEPRCLLAGLVQVGFANGDLVVRGDEAANVFQIEQTADPTGELRGAGQLMIVPDAETSINGLAPGEPLNLGSQALRGVRIFPGDGDDQFSLSGLAVADRLKIRNTGGVDSIEISDSTLETADIEGGPDGSAASLTRVGIGRPIDKSSPLLYRSIKTENTDLSLSETTIRSSADITFDKNTRGSIKIYLSRVEGQLSISGGAAGGEAVLTDVSLARPIDKATPKLFEALVIKNLDVEAQRVSAGGSAEVRFNGPSDEQNKISFTDFDGDGSLDIIAPHRTLNVKLQGANAARGGYLKLGDIKGELVAPAGDGETDKGGNQVVIADSTFGDRLRADSDGPLHVEATSSSASGVFIKIGSIEGETADRRRSSVTLGDIKLEGALRVESGLPLDVSIDKSSTRSAYLKFDGVEGETIDRPPNSLALTETAIEQSLEAASRGPLAVSIDKSSTRAAYLKFDGVEGEAADKLHSSIDISSTTIDGDLTIEGRGAANVAIDKSSTRSAYLKLGDIKGEATDREPNSVVLTEMAVERDLTIESSGPLDVSVDKSSTRAANIKIEGVEGESVDKIRKSQIDLQGFKLDNSLRVEVAVPSDITLAGSEAKGHVYLKVEYREANASSISLNGNKLGGNLRIHSDGGALDVTANDTDVAEDFSVRLRPPGGGISGQTRQRLAIQGGSAGGAISVASQQPLDVSLESTSAEGDISLDLNPRRERGSGLATGIRMRGVSTQGSLLVEHVGAVDFDGADVSAAADVFIKIESIPGEADDKSRVMLIDATVGGQLKIESAGGEETVLIEGLRASGRTRIVLDGGNDSLTVRDSVFADTTVFAGGGGIDTLTLGGVTFLGRSRISGWEFEMDEGAGDGTNQISAGSAE